MVKMRHILVFFLICSTYTTIVCHLEKEESCAEPDSTTTSLNDDIDACSGDKDMKCTRDTSDMYNNYDKKSSSDIDDLVNQAKDIASAMIGNSIPFDASIIADILNDDKTVEEETKGSKEDVFEYHPMPRRDPVAIGHIDTVGFADGRKTTIKTLAKRPPVFEIENFLTDEECEKLMDTAKRTKLARGPEKGDESVPNRHSKVTRLKPPQIDVDFLSTIQGRISAITKIPLYMIEASEILKVGQYDAGGFYNAHLDASGENPKVMPCCFQVPCYDSEGNEYEEEDCCSFCRYITFLYYLNDVEEGGETAFPFADLGFSEMTNRKDNIPDWYNLTKHCESSALVVKPVKGKAVYWYNRLLDSRGYLGSVDRRGYHGGCGIKAGSKWIGVNLVSSPIYEQRFTPSRYKNVTETYGKYVRSQTKT